MLCRVVLGYFQEIYLKLLSLKALKPSFVRRTTGPENSFCTNTSGPYWVRSPAGEMPELNTLPHLTVGDSQRKQFVNHVIRGSMKLLEYTEMYSHTNTALQNVFYKSETPTLMPRSHIKIF